MNSEIRLATARDVPALLPLIEQYWLFEDLPGFDGPRVGRELARATADPNLASAWIALAKGQAVGYLLAVYVFSLEHLGLTAEIDEFFVLPSARGRGIGDVPASPRGDGVRTPRVHQRLAAARPRQRPCPGVLPRTGLRRTRGL